MTGLQLLGIGILSAVATGLFAVTSMATDWRFALFAWTMSILLTAIVVVGILLASGTPIAEFLGS